LGFRRYRSGSPDVESEKKDASTGFWSRDPVVCTSANCMAVSSHVKMPTSPALSPVPRTWVGVWCLVFGVWCLVFGVGGLVFGVWCLGFGVR